MSARVARWPERPREGDGLHGRRSAGLKQQKMAGPPTRKVE
jgi:hypothetical protein